MSEVNLADDNALDASENTPKGKASNTVTLADETLHVTVNGLDKVWSFTSGLEIPLAHVMGATIDRGILDDLHGSFRSPGLATSGKKTGTFRLADGDVEFWNIKQPEQPLVIQLHDEKYDRLVLGVADPRAVTDAINAAIG
ncbi:hypothetical protein GA0061078_0386 [Bifidobacterium bohemicum]|uniref:Bacterial Pleckstrin homology domain-containing protein n=1 Tax=Bifidobacterium bohemicum DSM 22767 TaxID=1437606 RepID=A0A086ZJD4_9BIFI|nr:hypothetical protein [Bifidobacterium bohemicum]KFI46634.1 hypothetical protein BBOH_0106 [Bifidobacterium bohemicum DSM 22767]SCB77316.1 hypothetical protein GA0061078_0386 [Bifidobacterium bohemicum]